MKTLNLFACSILFIASSLFAEDANTYYHMGAQGYIGGKLGEAIAAVERGLELEPGHPELQSLYEKLKEEQEKQQQQQDQQQQDQQNQDEQQQQQDQQQQDQQNQEKQDQEEQDQQNQEDQEQQDQEEQDHQQNQQDQQNEDKQQQPPKPEVGEEEKKDISKEEAERILQALRSKEKENKKLRKPKARGKGTVAKDW